MSWEILNGDCLPIMKTFPDNHFSAIVTDSPYGISFMSKHWDKQIPGPEYWSEMLRIIKPGGHLIAAGLPRMLHRLTCVIEDSGWQIRDLLMHLFGSGFPKSYNHFGLEGYGTALKPAHEDWILAQKPLSLNTEQDIIVGNLHKLWCQLCLMLPVNAAETIFTSNNLDMNAALDFAQWDAEKKSNTQADLYALMDMSRLEKVLISCLSIVLLWKSTLEEHWKNGSMSTTSTKINPTIDLKILKSCLSQLTPRIIILEEIKQHGSWLNALTAARYLNAVVMNLNATRELSVLENAINKDGLNLYPNWEGWILAMKPCEGTYAQNAEKWGVAGINIAETRIEGKRWPANLLLDSEAAAMLDQMSGIEASRFFKVMDGNSEQLRFKYQAKASSAERNEGLEDMPKKESRPLGISNWEGQTNGSGQTMGKSAPQSNFHPTVKPIKLMEYLIKLIKPPGNPIILDPFMGSGTSLLACKNLGVRAIGIELNEEYCAIARKRIESCKIPLEQYEMDM
jgi:DNA modification methylase